MENVFFGCRTAFEYWRLVSSGQLGSWRKNGRALTGRAHPDVFPLVSDADAAELFQGAWAPRARRAFREEAIACLIPAGMPNPATLPIELLVHRAPDRSKSDVFACHVWGTPLPHGAFAAVDRQTFLSSPAFTLLQLAARCDIPTLAQLAFEFCGTYALDRQAARGFLDARSLMAPVDLASTLEGVRGVRGAKRARVVLDMLVAGSASPMETNLAILLCAPRRIGGYALPLPSMNHRIELAGEARTMASGRTHLSCDLFWPEFSLAVEYDSDAFHTAAEQIAHDSERRNVLAYLGINVISMTRRQIMSPMGTDRVVRLIDRHMGVERCDGPEDYDRRRILRRQLFADGPSANAP